MRRNLQAAAEASLELGATLDFMRTLWGLNHAIETASKRMEGRLGVTVQQRMVLRIVGRFPSISAGRLAALLRVHPGTLSATLNRLERRSLIKRRRDPRDQRRVLLGLTEAGRSFDVPAEDTVESAVHATLAQVSAEDVRSALSTLGALVVQLEAKLHDGDQGATKARRKADSPGPSMDQSSSRVPRSSKV